MSRAQGGVRATAPAASAAYGPRAASGSGGWRRRKSAASRAAASRLELGPVCREHRLELGDRPGRVEDPEPCRDRADLRDVAVGLVRGERRGGQLLVGDEEALGLGGVHPGEQVGVVGGIPPPVGGGARDRRWMPRTRAMTRSASGIVP